MVWIKHDFRIFRDRNKQKRDMRIKSFLGLILIFLVLEEAVAQTDTLLSVILDSVVVTGYDSEQQLREVPGGIHLLKSRELTGFDEENILTSINVLPGVHMEQRSPGSYRMAIRGSTLRSPFGVRNVKFYWNGIPFTNPTGSTDLNFLDNFHMKQIEVIKGPAGSVYGAGTGGVVNINSLVSDQKPDGWMAGIQAGSYGFSKWQGEKGFGTEEKRTVLRAVHQQSEGYRDHTGFKRTSGELSSRLKVTDAHTFYSHLLFSAVDYQIPGGLTLEEYEVNRQQARPPTAFALGSEEAESGVRHQLWLGGMTHEYRKDRLSLHSTFHGSLSPFDHPFNSDYKRELRTVFGGRSRVDYLWTLGSGILKTTLGGEYQHGFNIARNFKNDYGVSGALNFDDELTSDDLILFGRVEYTFADYNFLTLGVSRNFLKYGIDRVVDRQLDTSYQIIKSFDPVWVPRVGFSRMKEHFGWHASVSMGYSPPAIEDVRTNEGSINEDLKSEIGINYEAGVRSALLGKRIFLDWTLYYFNLRETIVQQSSPRGTVLFENSGSTDQYGMETLVKTAFLIGTAKDQSLQLTASHALHLYYFDEYSKFVGSEVKDYSGNQLTGVPRNIFSASLQWGKIPVGLYVNAMIQAVGEIPLNDENSVFSSAYQDVSLKAGYSFRISGGAVTEVYAGVRNALNQEYSLGNDLNAFGNRYYQPAALRNFYAGVKVGI